ncbi:MAG: sugar transferase [Planctomycetes bacterium]|nr:sugar transferase [Planctomycetota bacterium]
MSHVVHGAQEVDQSSRRQCAEELLVDGVPDDVAPVRYLRWMGLANRLAAVVLAVPALPLTMLLIMLVQMTSRGPGLYRQRRVGRNGRVFWLYKIRTMLHNAEAKTGPVWTAPNDPRITKFGKLLRVTHLDELPQLLNVLRGQMALIGPRPERPEFTQYLARDIPGYMNRYHVRPGITGLAQVNLPPDTDVESVRRKLVLDLEYIRGTGLKMDVKILVCTFVRLLGLSGMGTAERLGLLRDPLVPNYMRRQHSAGDAPKIFREAAAHATNGTPTNGTDGTATNDVTTGGNGKPRKGRVSTV